MKIHNVAQGSPEWLALRAEHFTASEAPAMMGCSKYQSRTELLAQKKTGLTPEIDAFTQKNFDRGHATEALARPIVEQMIGEELYPVVGSKGQYLSSMDGLSMLGDIVLEHKLWNAELVDQVKACDLSPTYYWQLEQQLMVSGAEYAIFVCSDGTEENMVHMEYRAVPGRAEQLVAGWKQFEQDLAEFVAPAPKQVEAAGKAPDSLPALRIEVTGMVTASNLALFKSHALSVIGSINRDLVTDQDFADAEQTVKWCKDVEGRIQAAKQHALSQTASIEELFRTLDDIGEETRTTRLNLDKLVKAMKDNRRAEILNGAANALNDHITAINKRLGSFQISSFRADFAGAMKGKRTISSLQDAADSELARAKIEINAQADAIHANMVSYKELADGFEFLFSDIQGFIGKSNDDFCSLVRLRISDHKVAEEKRLEAERLRIRAEEQAKAERDAESKRLAEEKLKRDAEAKAQHEAEEKEHIEAAAVVKPEPEQVSDPVPVVERAPIAQQEPVKTPLPTAEPAMVTITKAEYDDLINARDMLGALEGAGVNNWDGYSFAMSLLKAA